MLAGVTIVDPQHVCIDAAVELGAGRRHRAQRHPPRRARGSARDTLIGAGSRIVDSVVGERCRIWSSVLESCEVEDDVTIGPFAHLRAGRLDRRRRRARQLRRGEERAASAPAPSSTTSATSATRRSASGVNIGAGTDHRQLRRHAQAPHGRSATAPSSARTRCSWRRSTIGEGAATGAGSVVTHDVPPGKLAVGVPAARRASASGNRPDGRRPDGHAGRDPHHRRPHPDQRASSWPPRSPWSPSGADAHRAARRRGQPIGAARASADRPAWPLPRRHPARDHLRRLPRLGLRGGQPHGRAAGLLR